MWESTSLCMLPSGLCYHRLEQHSRSLWGLALIPFCLCYPLDGGMRHLLPQTSQEQEGWGSGKLCLPCCGSLCPWHCMGVICIRAEVMEAAVPALCLQWLKGRAAQYSPKSTKSCNFTGQMQVLAWFCRSEESVYRAGNCMVCWGKGSEFSGRWDPTKSNKVVVQIEDGRCLLTFQGWSWWKVSHISVAVFPVAQNLEYCVKNRKRWEEARWQP